MITGATSSMMDLEVFDERDKFVCKLDNNVALLGSYPIENNMRIHVCICVNTYIRTCIYNLYICL